MKKVILIHVFLASSVLVFGQNIENPRSKWSIYWHPGSNREFNTRQYTGLDDHAPYVLNSKLKPEGYEPEYNEYTSRSSSNLFSLFHLGVEYNFGQWFAKSEKLSFSLRSGINYLGESWDSRWQSAVTQNLLDSTYNSDFDIILQRDSVFTEDFYTSVASQQFRWQNEFLVRRKLPARFTFVYGLGLGLNVNLDMKFRISKTNSEYEITTSTHGNTLVDYTVNPQFFGYIAYQSNGIISQNSKLFQEEEVVRLNDELGFIGYIPLGLEFTIGKKENALSRISVYYEVQLGYKYERDAFKDWGEIAIFNHGFGVKYDI